jgi:hypothetical protein
VKIANGPLVNGAGREATAIAHNRESSKKVTKENAVT